MNKMTAELEIVSNKDGIEAKLTLCNKDKSHYFISKRALLNKKDSWLNTIEVTRDGEKVDYIGASVKLMAEEFPGDYIELKPGKSKTSKTILNQYFDLTKPGEYEAQYKFYNSNHETDELDIIRSEIKKFTIN